MSTTISRRAFTAGTIATIAGGGCRLRGDLRNG